MEFVPSLSSILARYAGQNCKEKRPAIPKVTRANQQIVVGLKAEMTVLANPPRSEQVYQVIAKAEGRRRVLGRSFTSQVIYPMKEPTREDLSAIGYMLMDGQGLFCYDVSGGTAIIVASLASIIRANRNPVKNRIPFYAEEFSSLRIEGLMGAVHEDEVAAFEELAPGQTIITNTLAFTIVLHDGEQTNKIAVCRTPRFAVGVPHPVWNLEAFDNGSFDVENARLVGLIK